MIEKKNIVILCYANYCRSPVAEKILSTKNFEALKFSSYGINPLVGSSMDPRSEKYLTSNNILETNHFPRKIQEQILEKSHLVLCMDHQVLMHMNQRYKKFNNKFRIFSFKEPSIMIEDPYKLEENKYINVMKKIHNACNNLNEIDFS